MSESLNENYIIPLTFLLVVTANTVNEKQQFCNTLTCDVNSTARVEPPVCGIRPEGEGYRFRLFESECLLLKYGCEVDDKHAYGLIDISYCNNSISNNPNSNPATMKYQGNFNEDDYIDTDCTDSLDSKMACGVQPVLDKYKIKLFRNKCELLKYNCKHKTNFTVTDIFICNDLDVSEFNVANNSIRNNANHSFSDKFNKGFRLRNLKALADVQKAKNLSISNSKLKNIIIVDSTMLTMGENINDTIDNFFAATHVLDLPLKEVNSDILNETTRRMFIKSAGPVKVYKPWITIPKEIKDDKDHLPLLNSCFHKCPKKCPDTYAPVCGNPGFVLAREPSLVFQNHCYMDVAQCKMYWENKSISARTSAYVESSFTFCLGVQMNGLYRFLPLVRTLQHMGRLKKKGTFKYKVINMKFFNNNFARQPRIMG